MINWLPFPTPPPGTPAPPFLLWEQRVLRTLPTLFPFFFSWLGDTSFRRLPPSPFRPGLPAPLFCWPCAAQAGSTPRLSRDSMTCTQVDAICKAFHYSQQGRPATAVIHEPQRYLSTLSCDECSHEADHTPLLYRDLRVGASRARSAPPLHQRPTLQGGSALVRYPSLWLIHSRWCVHRDPNHSVGLSPAVRLATFSDCRLPSRSGAI